MSHSSSVPLFWRLKKSKYMMIGSKCDNCGQVFFPPRVVCAKCRSKGRIADFQFSGNGAIESFTVIRVPPEGFEKAAPYAIAIIKLDEGTNISGQVVGNIEEADIDIVGPTVATIAQSYAMPITFGSNKELLKDAGSQGS